MVFARTVGRKFGSKAREKAESSDNDFAHVTAGITAWKASVNR